MSSSDDEDAYVPYGDRPEWSDVVPLEQPDSANPVVRIAYAEEYADTMNYFRAVYASGEVSERALALTESAIALNGANYTVWHRRWELVKALCADLDAELEYVAAKCRANPKNYQVWNHIRLVSARVGAAAAARNLQYTAEALAADAKNIHAWSHRMWCVRAFGLWAEELAYTEAMIDADVRNNSAWNERFFCVAEGPKGADDGADDGTAKRDRDRFDDELDFVERRIAVAPDNESAWNYLRGLLRHPDVGWTRGGWRGERVARAHCGAHASKGADPSKGADASKGADSDASDSAPFLRHAWSLLAESRLAAGDGKEAARAFAALERRDPVRANYWAFRRAHVEGRLVRGDGR
jgi:protein farnesyltransferase/geranylgeranyltransferase type-1 subunit alpha